MTPCGLGAGGPCRGAAWIIQSQEPGKWQYDTTLRWQLHENPTLKFHEISGNLFCIVYITVMLVMNREFTAVSNLLLTAEHGAAWEVVDTSPLNLGWFIAHHWCFTKTHDWFKEIFNINSTTPQTSWKSKCTPYPPPNANSSSRK